MLNEEICNLRDKLNKSIEEGEDYESILKLSVELDKLIGKFYKIGYKNIDNLRRLFKSSFFKNIKACSTNKKQLHFSKKRYIIFSYNDK